MKGHKGTQQHDVVIIGGGVVGTALAYFLAAPHHDPFCQSLRNIIRPSKATAPNRRLIITLLEKQTIASEASSLSAGTIWCTGPPTLPSPFPTFRWLSTLLYQHLQKHDESVEYIQCGGFQLACTDEEKVYGKKVFDEDQKSGGTSIWFDSLSKLKESNIIPGYLLTNSNAVAAMYSPFCGQVNGGMASHALAALAGKESILKMASGDNGLDSVNIVEGCEVFQIDEITNDDTSVWGYDVRCKDGTNLLAHNVILANGAWANSIQLPPSCPQMLPIEGVKGQIVVSAPVSEAKLVSDYDCKADKSSWFPIIYFFQAHLFWAKNKVTWPAQMTHKRSGERTTSHAYGRLAPDGRFYFGGDRTHLKKAFKPTYEDYEPDSSMLSQLLDTKIYPTLLGVQGWFTGDNADEVGSWAGVMPFSVDGLPIIDDLSTPKECGNISRVQPRLWICSGFGPSGIMDGPGAAFLLSEWIRTGKKPELLEPFGMNRGGRGNKQP